MRVFITGATGVVGRRLIRRLIKRGDQVVALSRQADAWEKVGQDVTIVVGDPNESGEWQTKLAECDAVVNLAGAGIFDRRWNDEYKTVMLRLLRPFGLPRASSHFVIADWFSFPLRWASLAFSSAVARRSVVETPV